MSDHNHENLSNQAKYLIENMPGEVKKSMPIEEKRSMPIGQRSETPEDYQDLLARLKKVAESKKN